MAAAWLAAAGVSHAVLEPRPAGLYDAVDCDHKPGTVDPATPQSDPGNGLPLVLLDDGRPAPSSMPWSHL
jgi:hypothetical protein